MIHSSIIFVVIAMISLSLSNKAAAASREIPGRTLTFVVSAEPLANLLYELDCITEISICSRRMYQDYWNASIGSEQDLLPYLSHWRQLKKKYQGSFQYKAPDGLRRQTAVPTRDDGFDLKQRIEIAQMTAKSLDDLQSKLEILLTPQDSRALVNTAAHFETKFNSLWKQNAEGKLNVFIEDMLKLTAQIHLVDFFESVVGLMAAEIPPHMKFYFHLMAQPESKSKSSQAAEIENHSLVEVGFNDHASGRIDVISHEAFHYFYHAAPLQKHVELVKRFSNDGAPHAIAAYNLLNESLATALGNGLVAEKTETPEGFQRYAGKPNSFYDDPGIDATAKSLLPIMRKYIREKRSIYGPDFVTDYLAKYREGLGDAVGSPRYLLKNMEMIVAPELETAAQKLADQLQCNDNWGFRFGEAESIDRLARYPQLNAVMFLSHANLEMLDRYSLILGSEEVTKLKALGKIKTAFTYGISRNPKASIFIFVADKSENLNELIDIFLKQTHSFNGELGSKQSSPN